MSNTNTPNDNRLTTINTWLQTIISDDFTIDSLAGDASTRRYHRIIMADKVYILMDSIADLTSLDKFITVEQLMVDYVNVPDIIAKNLDEGLLLLQDFGTVEFADVLINASDQQIDHYYSQAINVIHNIQSIDSTQANLPHYDQPLLMREMGLFTEWFLPYIEVNQSDNFNNLWHNLTFELIQQIQQQPQVVVHRDFHSRNLMIDHNSDNPLGVIDFQDAVIGAYSYDLVSLVRDAYVNWEETRVEKWIKEFYQGLNTDRSFQQFYQDVTIIGIQRQLKVLGIFVRLSQRDGKNRYLDNIPKVMNDMLFELTWLKDNAQGRIKQLASEFLTLLESDILPKFNETFGLTICQR